MNLLVQVFPCPKGSLRHREFVRATGGKDQCVKLLNSVLDTYYFIISSLLIWFQIFYFCAGFLSSWIQILEFLFTRAVSFQLLLDVVAFCTFVEALVTHCFIFGLHNFVRCTAADIVQYLFNEYGAGGQPTPGLLERWYFFTQVLFLPYLLI